MSVENFTSDSLNKYENQRNNNMLLNTIQIKNETDDFALIAEPEKSLQKPANELNNSSLLDEFIRIPRTTKTSLPVTPHEASMYAMKINPKSGALCKERMVEAKRKKMVREFKLGEMHDGSLDEMIIHGQNILQKEIRHAWDIPARERVIVRTDC